jgi:hypothetical protein
VRARRGYPVVAAALAASLLPAAAAHAAGRPAGLTASAQGAHVVVHYDATATSPAEANAVAAAADRAWTVAVVNWGFAAPPSDESLGGDARLDVYLTAGGGGVRSDGVSSGPTSGYLTLAPSSSGADVARAFFRLVADGYDVADAGFATAATAELLAANLYPSGDIARPAFLTAPGRSLDCGQPVCGVGGEAQWPFLEFLRERYGSGTISDLWSRLASPVGGVSAPLRALSDALRARGTTLAAAWNGYARANLLPSSYTNRVLRTLQSTPPATSLSLPTQAGVTGWVQSTLPHLATSYVLVRSARCTTVHVKPNRLTVSVPTATRTGAVPAVRVTGRTGGSKVQTLRVQNGTATATVPFAPCSTVLLALPNPSLRDDVTFRVSLKVR